MLNLGHIVQLENPPTRCPALTSWDYAIRAVVSLGNICGVVWPKTFDVKTQVSDRSGPTVGDGDFNMFGLAGGGLSRRNGYALGIGFQLFSPILVQREDQTNSDDQPTWITKTGPQQCEGQHYEQPADQANCYGHSANFTCVIVEHRALPILGFKLTDSGGGIRCCGLHLGCLAVEQANSGFKSLHRNFLQLSPFSAMAIPPWARPFCDPVGD